MQTVLNNSKLGTTLYDGIKDLSVSSDAKFTLQSNSDGSVTVESSDAATKAAVQAFFDDNPALVKKFNQIQALSGLDDARKSLQISPSEMRKRIEVESMPIAGHVAGVLVAAAQQHIRRAPALAQNNVGFFPRP
jgi:hypothetical protein